MSAPVVVCGGYAVDGSTEKPLSASPSVDDVVLVAEKNSLSAYSKGILCVSDMNIDKHHKHHKAPQEELESVVTKNTEAPQSTTKYRTAEDVKAGVARAMAAWSHRRDTDPRFRAKLEEQARDDRAMAYREEKAQARAAAGLPLPPPTEYAEQRVLCDWLHARHVIYAANTEGSYHDSAKRGAMRRAIGGKAGRPDIEIFSVVPNAPKARGVGLELKRAKGGKLSDAQVGWGAKLEACGWLWRCCHGADEAIAWLTELGF